MDLVIIQSEDNDLSKFKFTFDNMEIKIIQYRIEENWENDRSFFEIVTGNEYFFIITNKKSFSEKWFKFIVGYCLGKNCSLYLFMTEKNIVIPEKLSFIRYGSDLDDISLFYKQTHEEWKKKNEIKEYKTKLTEKGLYFTPYHFFHCIEQDDYEAISYYLKAGYSADVENEKGVLAFNYAVRYNKIKIAGLLMEYKCNIFSISNDNQHNALMEAAANGNSDFADFLISSGIDLNVQSKNEQTALMIATGRNDEKTVELLLKAGADQNLKDVLDMTANMYAEILKYKNIVALYKKYKKSR